jgi:hypothetical protein
VFTHTEEIAEHDRGVGGRGAGVEEEEEKNRRRRRSVE